MNHMCCMLLGPAISKRVTCICINTMRKILIFSLLLFILFFRAEHERHCPECSFVRGNNTINVPMSG